MKLAELRGAIRKTKGNPKINVSIGAGVPMMELVIQKTPLLDTLGEVFNNDKDAETGLIFDESTGLLYETASAHGAEDALSEPEGDGDLPAEPEGDGDLLV